MVGNCTERVKSILQEAFNLVSDIKVGKYSVKTIAQVTINRAIGTVNENQHYYEDGLKKYKEVADKLNAKKQEYTDRANEAKNYIQNIIAQVLGVIFYLFDCFFGSYVKVAQDKTQAARTKLTAGLVEVNAFAQENVAYATDKLNQQKEYVQARVNELEGTMKENVTHRREELLTRVENLRVLAQPYINQAKPYVEQAVIYAQPLVERAKPYLERLSPYVLPYVDRLLVLLDKYDILGILFLRERIESWINHPAKPVELVRLEEELKIIREETVASKGEDVSEEQEESEESSE